MTSEERHPADIRRELRQALVELADNDALTDPYWDCVLAVDNQEKPLELRRLWRLAALTERSPLLQYRARRLLRELEETTERRQP